MGEQWGGGIVERLRGYARYITVGDRSRAGRVMGEAADLIDEMAAALEGVNSWLSRHGQRNEEGFFFEGLPRPEVGVLRDRVRAALAKAKGGA